MSLRQNILEVDGECASLSKVVRACAILMNYANKKIMNENELKTAIFICFSGKKQKRALKNIRKTHMVEKDYTLFEEKQLKIRSLIFQNGIKKMNDNLIIYLDSVYENIHTYVEEEIEYTTTYNVNFFVKKCIDIFFYEKKYKYMKAQHFDVVHNILCPIVPILFIWDVEKTKENLQNILSRNWCATITDSFFEKFNYKILST